MLRSLVLVLAFAASLVACGTFEKHDEKTVTDARVLVLKVKVSEWTNAYLAKADPSSHWPSVTDCDSTLWMGIAAAGGLGSDISLAEYSPGEIHRRPRIPCWNPVEKDAAGSASTISNDQLLGYIWGAWRTGNLPALQRLATYGEDHSWVMGQPSTAVGDVVIKSNVLGLLGRTINALSHGTDKRPYRSTFEFYTDTDKDYVRHLQALSIVLHGEATSGDLSLLEINGDMLKRLRELTEAEPENPGFEVALSLYTGDQKRAFDLLLSDATPMPTYVRGGNPEAFWLAEKLFWASVLLRHTEG